MKKRMLSLLLALVMVLAVLPVGAMAAEEGPTIIQLPDEVTRVVKDDDSFPPRFYEGFLRVYTTSDNGLRCGFVDKTGKIVIPMEYDYAYPDFSGGFVAVGKNGKEGMIDATGKVVVPLEYDQIIGPTEGLIIARKGKTIDSTTYGVFDTTGKLVIPFRDWSYGLGFYGNAAIVCVGYKYGLANKEGELILPAEYDSILNSTSGTVPSNIFTLVKKDENGKSRYGLAADSGKILLPVEYDSISYSLPIGADAGAYVAKKGSETRYFNTEGEEVSKPQGITNPKKTVKVKDYDAEYTGYFKNGLAAWRSSEWGTFEKILIDETGKTVFPRGFMANHSLAGYDPGTMFTDGLVILTVETGETNEQGGKVTKDGVADQAGNVVVPFVFDYIYYIREEACVARRDGKYYIIDFSGMTLPLQNPTRTLMDPMEKLTEEPTGKPEEKPAVEPEPNPPATGTYTGKPTNDALKVDGKAQVPTAYKIGDSNYFQLRDVAMMLSGTPAQFSVDYDAERQAVIIVTGQPYKPLGTELAGAAQSDAEAILGNNDIYINGVKTDFAVYKINGANFFQIRALGQALGFNVGWTKADGMFIESDKPYTDAN